MKLIELKKKVSLKILKYAQIFGIERHDSPQHYKNSPYCILQLYFDLGISSCHFAPFNRTQLLYLLVQYLRTCACDTNRSSSQAAVHLSTFHDGDERLYTCTCEREFQLVFS